jgi:hypothetical protein
MMILFAAHQGEEFVLALPAIMLVGAFFIMRWANRGEAEDTSDEAPDEVAAEEPEVASEDRSVEDAVQSRR